MSPLSISVQLGSADRLMDHLLRQTSPLAQASFMAGTVSPYLSMRAQGRFDSSTSPSGSPWAALEDSTVSWRKSLGFTPGTGPGEINVRTGRLRDWLARPSIAAVGTADGALMQWPSRESVGEDMQHRLAQAAGQRKGPARWVVGYNATDVAYILGSMESFIIPGVAS